MKKLWYTIAGILPWLTYAQTVDSTKVYVLNEVLVSAVRAAAGTPMTYTNLSPQQIAPKNLGQDLPILLNFLPSVVTTSDAGNGFGYTSLRVRGSDGTRVNVTINGIPYNDAESSMSYFVDMPDFASSAESIQLQRGVGTSTNGSGAFGASLNILTENASENAFATLSNSVGSYNSRKHTLKFGTGMLNGIEFSGRFSKLYSDGYIDRAFADLKSYYLQSTYKEAQTIIKALAFGGLEKTYQAWNGIDAETLQNNPRFNYSGMYTDENGNTRFYDNEIDHYQQDHYQLHWSQQYNSPWSTHLALHYTQGKGYYENYKEDAKLSSYGMPNVNTITHTDLIRQKWLDNDFYGYTATLKYKPKNWNILLGNSLHQYKGLHYGKVIWARYASNSELGDTYYNNYGNKADANVFIKANHALTRKLFIYTDVQYRNVNYKATGILPDVLEAQYQFFNPKAGLTYNLNHKNEFYLSFAKAQKEPNRTDFENGTPTAEKLNDWEAGWRYNTYNVKINLNAYYMDYRNQLVKTGELDEVGNEIRRNIDKSYRLGIEADAKIKYQKFELTTNITLSSNRITHDSLLKDTDLSFSPKLISGTELSYKPIEPLKVTVLQKSVGSQYAGNASVSTTRLSDYHTTDFLTTYTYTLNGIFKTVQANLLLNNIWNRKYVSNAYLYGDSYMSYFPQATRNIMIGLTLNF